jgi:hypothetical protein
VYKNKYVTDVVKEYKGTVRPELEFLKSLWGLGTEEE